MYSFIDKVKIGAEIVLVAYILLSALIVSLALIGFGFTNHQERCDIYTKKTVQCTKELRGEK